jgi:hypothetical protein
VIIRLAAGELPPTMELQHPCDFTRLSVMVEVPTHAWITREALVQLAGDYVGRDGWQDKLDAMIGFAAGQGWTDSAGRVRAHVETVVAPESGRER